MHADSLQNKQKDFIGHFVHGLKLKSYKFNKYQSKKDTKNISLNIVELKNKTSSLSKLKFKALEEGTFLRKRFSFGTRKHFTS